MMDKISDVTRQDIIDVIRNGFVVSFDEPHMIVVTVVDADNDAHGKYLHFLYSTIYNKRLPFGASGIFA